MSDLVGFEPPKIDWTLSGPALELRFKRFRQKCELLFDDRVQKNKNVSTYSSGQETTASTGLIHGL